jgi:Aldehyde dehydrogenase family
MQIRSFRGRLDDGLSRPVFKVSPSAERKTAVDADGLSCDLRAWPFAMKSRRGGAKMSIAPTVFGNVNNNMRSAREEIFGPVVSNRRC